MKPKDIILIACALALGIVLICSIRFSLSPVFGTTTIQEYPDSEPAPSDDVPIRYKWEIKESGNRFLDNYTIVTCFEDIETGNEYLVFKEVESINNNIVGIELIERDMTVRKENK